MAILKGVPTYLRALAGLTVVTLLCLTVAEGAMEDIGPQDVEVAFIYNFAKFVEWPASAFSSAAAALTICTVGSDPVVDGLLELKGKVAQERNVRVQAILLPADALSCQILFLSDAEKERFPEFFNAVRGRSVLTVGTTDRFAERGGMIGFFLENRKVRFAINLGEARRSNLVVSSKLIAVARVVETQ